MDLWDLALGFMDAQMLLTADELGVFGLLAEHPRTAGEIARRTGLPEDSAERLLTGLCTLGVVRRRRDGRFRNGPEAAAQLVPGRSGYIGSMFGHLRRELYPLWGHLRAALERGEAPWEETFGSEERRHAMHEDPDALRAFHDGMHAIAYEAAADFAEQAAEELGRIEHVVDVGGSSGGFLIALAERHPQLHGTVFDLPQVRPIAEERFREQGLDARLRFHGGSFFDDPLPEGADAYALGFILHDWDEHANARLLEGIADAAEPGALLIVGEYLLDDDKTGPRWVARSNLNMLVAAQGRERTAGEYIELVERHGFEYENIWLTGKGKHFLQARRR